jgi:hypothetical protein
MTKCASCQVQCAVPLPSGHGDHCHGIQGYRSRRAAAPSGPNRAAVPRQAARPHPAVLGGRPAETARGETMRIMLHADPAQCEANRLRRGHTRCLFRLRLRRPCLWFDGWPVVAVLPGGCAHVVTPHHTCSLQAAEAMKELLLLQEMVGRGAACGPGAACHCVSTVRGALPMLTAALRCAVTMQLAFAQDVPSR